MRTGGLETDDWRTTNWGFAKKYHRFARQNLLLLQTIEIRKGVRVGSEEMLKGAAQMSISELENYAESIRWLLLKRKKQSAGEEEAALLEAIRNIIPAAVRRREKVLYGKMKNETITAKEREELSFLLNWMEEKSAERLELMARLARLRGIGLPELARELRLTTYHA